MGILMTALFFVSLVFFVLALIKPQVFILWKQKRRRYHSLLYLALAFIILISTNIFYLLAFICLILFILALVNPHRFVFFIKHKEKAHCLIYIGIAVVFISLGSLGDNGDQKINITENQQVKSETLINKKAAKAPSSNPAAAPSKSVENHAKGTKNNVKNTVTSTEKSVKNTDNNVKNIKVSPKPVQKTQAAPPQPSNQVPVTLVRTVDGDTIKVNYQNHVESVRYLLIDTPESKKPGTCVQPYAESAYYRNKQLVNSGKLTLEFEKSKRDKYQRLLAYVFVNGQSVQEQLLKEGYARVAYIYEPPYKYLSKYQQDEDIAQNKHLNIWSQSGYVNDYGFNGCVSGTQTSTSTTVPKTTTPSTSSSIEYFQNCTELRKKYPQGVPSTHPAYQAKMDRDHDGYACE